MDHQQSAGSGRDPAQQGGAIDLPVSVVDQGIVDQFQIVQAGKEIKKRIAGAWHKEAISCICQEAESEGISFAGARCEKDLSGIEMNAAFGVIFGHSAAGG